MSERVDLENIPWVSQSTDRIRQDIEHLLEAKKSTQEPVIVAIDGRCGSGKTTLGEKLAEIYQCALFHMDDFYLRAEQRTPERLNAPGGNVDYERFEEEILIPIRTGQPVILRRIIHGLFQPGEPEEIQTTPLIIVEGAYSNHPNLRKYYDYKIFMTIDRESQSQRILKRNGEEKHKMFLARWIPMEENYIKTLRISEEFDLILEGK